MSSNVFKKEYINGSVYHINFGWTFHPELKSKHLGILYNIKSCDNMMFCIPMTSPKEKHFKSTAGFKSRDFNDLKYSHLYYIKETDSIVLIDQIRTISKARIESQYKNDNGKKIVLSNNEKIKLEKAIRKIVNGILE